MTTTEAGVIAALALADSTSIGTLVIPVWLMASPRAIPHRIVLYLGVLAAFYWTAGLILLAGVGYVVELVERLSGSRTWSWSQLAVGAVLLAIGLLIDRRGTATHPAPRLQRWRTRALHPSSARGPVVLALGAGTLELAGMLPYLAAIGMVAQTELPPVSAAMVLAIYVLIMTLPAALLLMIRMVAADSVKPLLGRLEQWLDRHTNAVLGTVLIVVGGLLAADAALRLDLLPR